MKTGILYTALVALAFQPGIAEAKKKPVAPVAVAPVQLPYRSANLPTSGQVRAFYANWRFAPIWFSGNAVTPAANDLIEILRRASLDGIPMGPQYAVQAQAAVQQASVVGSPENIAFAEHTLSEALVLYAQMMERPVTGMIYGSNALKPKTSSADTVLRMAAGSRPLESYVRQLANPNTVYTSIRDAAWQQMKASGSLYVDPRVVANLDRARGMPARGRFVLVNPATQMLTMYENGVPVDSMKVVVGSLHKYNLPTPMISSTIYYVVHNPYWNVPHHLVRKMAPNVLSRGMSYLKSNGYEVMTDWTGDAKPVDPTTVDWKAVAAGDVQIRLRQKPRGDNSMGDLKFPFDNPEGIFLHDTPKKEYFQLASRDLSNGCVRLEDAKRFARWLLRREPVRPAEGAEVFEQLPQGVPVYVTYLTAQPQNGQLTFVKDIYGWDPAVGGSTQVAAGQ